MPRERGESHLGRYRQIAEVLVRHGLGYLVGAVGLERFVPFHQTLLGYPRRPRPYSPPEHLRMALGELGATFIKLGQIMSTRGDLLSPAYQAELTRLQDDAPPVPTDVIAEVLVAELGQPIEAAFGTFDRPPLAAASIGQVHAATRLDGAEVVVKVRRPGVAEQVEEDLEILQNLAAVASRRWGLASQYDVVGLAQEFAQTLRGELDYLSEGRNAERLAANFEGDEFVHIPRVYWETTTSRVLTLERLYGIRINDLAGLDAAGIDRHALATRATRIVLTMVFEHGFFHADPHPGNFFIEANGRIGLIDFGMVGAVDERTREQLAGVLLALASQDTEELIDTLLNLGVARQRVDRDLLRRDLDHLIARYYTQALGDIRLGPLLGDVFDVIRRHYLQLPPNLVLLLKTVVMSEGLGAQLDPSFRLTTVLEPYAGQLIAQQFSPTRWLQKLSQAGLDAVRLGVELPRQLRRIIGDLERGGLEVRMRPVGFEAFIRRLERLGNRVVLGIIAAAFINGLATLLAVYQPPGIAVWTGALFAMGFLVAVILGLYLAWSIIRSGRG